MRQNNDISSAQHAINGSSVEFQRIESFVKFVGYPLLLIKIGGIIIASPLFNWVYFLYEYKLYFTWGLDLLASALGIAFVMKLSRKLTSLCLRDPLTNVYNRRGLHYMIEMGGRNKFIQFEHKASSLFFVDIDCFKMINEKFGHDVGDIALKEVAHILRTSVRAIDYVARYGGDEFVVVLNGTPDGNWIAERIRKNCELRFQELGLPCTISIGVVENCAPRMPLSEMLQQANGLLFHAKHQRNRVSVSLAEEAKNIYFPQPINAVSLAI